jgi:hypothetical protein
MTLRKSSLYLIGIAVLILLCCTAKAASITDRTNDVWHWTQSGTTWSWSENVTNKPNIDITEVSTAISGNTLTLTLEVQGTIQSSKNILYSIYYNTTDTTYSLFWADGHGTGWAVKEGGYEQASNITSSDDNISGKFLILGNTSNIELWGQAVEYTSLDDQTTHDWWRDWAPNTKSPGAITDGENGSNNNVTDGENGSNNNITDDENGSINNGTTRKPSTPGFEAIAGIAAVFLVMILTRRNR